MSSKLYVTLLKPSYNNKLIMSLEKQKMKDHRSAVVEKMRQVPQSSRDTHLHCLTKRDVCYRTGVICENNQVMRCYKESASTRAATLTRENKGEAS